MGRTRMGRTDGLTDGQGGDYMLSRNFSWSIKKVYPMFQIQIIDTYNVFLFSQFTTYHRFKTKVKIIKFCWFF